MGWLGVHSCPIFCPCMLLKPCVRFNSRGGGLATGEGGEREVCCLVFTLSTGGEQRPQSQVEVICVTGRGGRRWCRLKLAISGQHIGSYPISSSGCSLNTCDRCRVEKLNLSFSACLLFIVMTAAFLCNCLNTVNGRKLFLHRSSSSEWCQATTWYVSWR